MAANRHQPAFVTGDIALEQTKVQDHGNGVTTEVVLGDPHAPDQDGVFGVADQLCKLTHAAPRKA